VLLETTDSADALEPDVAADRQGNAVAVWTQTDGAWVWVWATRRAAGADAWSAPTMLGGTGILAEGATPRARVALDAAGDGLAIWSLNTAAASQIWASRYHAATDTWDAAGPIDDQDIGAASDATLALDAGGGGFAAWRRGDGETFQLWANSFDARTGAWTGATRLDDDAGVPAVSATGDREARIVWLRRGGDGTIQASAFERRSSAWRPATPLQAGAPPAQTPGVALNDDGKALVLFTRRERDLYTLCAASHTAP
jgi:hypothetical protein